MNNNVSVLVIPDVHGRKFWKEAIDKFPKDIYPDLNIIFLGDYVDPYSSFEDITPEDAYNNFLEILEYIKNDSRIIPLIGNHDWHYFVNLDHSRIDRARERQIEKLFVNNLSYFRVTYSLDINNKKYIFSHAGVTKGWLNAVASMCKYEIENWNPVDIEQETDHRYIWMSKLQNINETYDLSLLEFCLKYYDEEFYSSPLSMISRYRGGWSWYGSCIWADLNEWNPYSTVIENKERNIFQIFGHTLIGGGDLDAAVIDEDNQFAMLDSRNAWIIDNKGSIINIKDIV